MPDGGVLLARDIRVCYGTPDGTGERHWQLNVPELCLDANTAYSFLGQNMAGKSTLVRLLTGTLDPRAVQSLSGRVEIDGRSIELPSSAASLRNAGIAAVHQNDPMFPELSIWENVLLGLPAAAHRRAVVEKARGRVQAVLRQLSPSDVGASEPLGRLSGGGRALVRILRSVVWGFRVLFLDEPTVNLDPGNVARCFSLLGECWTDGGAMVLVSHSPHDHDVLEALARERGYGYVKVPLENGHLVSSSDP